MFTVNSTPIPNPQIVDRILADEAVLVMAEAGQVKVLNQVGARIWQLIDGQRPISQIAQIIHEEFEVDLAECQQDTLTFINELANKGIVTPSGTK